MKNALGNVDTVLLFGGRSEIGLAIVSELVGAGAHKVILAARGGVDDEILRQVKASASDAAASADIDVLSLEFDGSAIDDHPAVVELAFEALGDVDVVIDAFAHLGSNAESERDPVAAAKSTVANFGGHVSIGLLVAERLRTQGHGTLVVLSSVAGVRVRKANYVYGATKAGLDGFASGLGDALAGTGASVLVVRPGFVHSQMTQGMDPAPFSTTPSAVGTAVAAALRAGKESVWVPAQLAPMFALLKNVPRAVWRKMPR
jgi:decaprenylphospho-beta-D-erythro-pentofuranosid-2-ulose 2-reductase